MSGRREHVETLLRVPADALALIDETVTKAREEFDDPEIDRQRVLAWDTVLPGRRLSAAGAGGLRRSFRNTS